MVMSCRIECTKKCLHIACGQASLSIKGLENQINFMRILKSPKVSMATKDEFRMIQESWLINFQAQHKKE